MRARDGGQRPLRLKGPVEPPERGSGNSGLDNGCFKVAELGRSGPGDGRHGLRLPKAEIHLPVAIPSVLLRGRTFLRRRLSLSVSQRDAPDTVLPTACQQSANSQSLCLFYRSIGMRCLPVSAIWLSHLSPLPPRLPR